MTLLSNKLAELGNKIENTKKGEILPIFRLLTLFKSNDKIFEAITVRKILLKIVVLARFALEISRMFIE